MGTKLGFQVCLSPAVRSQGVLSLPGPASQLHIQATPASWVSVMEGRGAKPGPWPLVREVATPSLAQVTSRKMLTASHCGGFSTHQVQANTFCNNSTDSSLQPSEGGAVAVPQAQRE